jgi:hypothetical protein
MQRCDSRWSPAAIGVKATYTSAMKPNRTLVEDVRYRRNSGKHLLMLRFSHFDPIRTSGALNGSALETVSYHYPSLYDVLSLAKAQTDLAFLKLWLLKEHGHGQHEGTHPQE